MNFKKRPGQEIKPIGKIENKQKATISIITPFYNGGKTIIETYNSVVNQTYPYFEWIIVNDGSKDDYSNKIITLITCETTNKERIIVHAIKTT